VLALRTGWRLPPGAEALSSQSVSAVTTSVYSINEG